MSDKEQEQRWERLRMASAMVMAEVRKAIDKYKPMNSCHEGYAVLDEEVDELWDEVKIKQGQRNMEKLTTEATQVAAMAMRFLVDLCLDGKQR